MAPRRVSPSLSLMRNRHFLLIDIIGLACVPFVVLLLRFEGFVWPSGYFQVALTYLALTLPLRIYLASNFRQFRRGRVVDLAAW